MSDEKKIISFEELDNLAPDFKIVTLPNLSKRACIEVNVKIRPIAPLDLLELYDVPMDEVNRSVAVGDGGPEAIGAIIEEQVKTFDIADVNKMMNSVVEKGLIDPTPASELVKRLDAADLGLLFSEIMALTNPKPDVDGAARFPDDGERGSG